MINVNRFRGSTSDRERRSLGLDRATGCCGRHTVTGLRPECRAWTWMWRPFEGWNWENEVATACLMRQAPACGGINRRSTELTLSSLGLPPAFAQTKTSLSRHRSREAALGY